MNKKTITKRFFPIVIALMLAVALVIPVAVVSAAPALATRTLPASADAGADFTVGIEASDCGIFGQVVETLPSGFSYVGTDSTDVNVTQDGNTISFTFMGDEVDFDYTVTASATEGSYSFSGIVKDEDLNEYTTGGDTDIDIDSGGTLVLLQPGWNIISTPIALDPSIDTWGEFSADLDIDSSAVTYYFDGSSQIWKQVSDSYEVKPCDAIYVKMASEDTVPIISSPLPSVPSKELYAGWNLVSLAYLGEVPGMKVNEALVSVEEVSGGLTGYKLVVSPSVNQAPWIYITGGAIADWNGEDLPPDGWMLIGNGYWVFMLNDGTLAGFTFTPLAQGT